MKVIEYYKYGPPEVLQLKDRTIPNPGKNEILIRIYATSASSGDARLRKADPFIVRFFFGLFRPKIKVLGYVLAGEVEAVGKDVRLFNEGDQVFGVTGMQFGAYAEYICLPVDKDDVILAIKPSNITYKEAAAIPFGALTALHFFNAAKINSRHKVLVYGASGAVGTAAVQLAKIFGATVIGVCSKSNMEMVKLLGADYVVDYTSEDFTYLGIDYDIIFDTTGKSSFSKCIKSLSFGGYYLRAVHMDLVSISKGLWTNFVSGKKVIGGEAKDTQENLLFLKQLIEQGILRAVIDRTYALEEIVEAHRYVDTGRKKGNVVVTIGSSLVSSVPKTKSVI